MISSDRYRRLPIPTSPQNPENSTDHDRNRNTQMSGPLANLDDDSVIDEIASGVLSKTIAARYGVSARGLRKHLAKHPDYAQAVKDQAASLVEDATELAMTCGSDEVPIARVRVEAAHKWARARDPEVWNDKPSQVVVNINNVGPDTLGDLSRVIDNVAAQLPHCDAGITDVESAKVEHDPDVDQQVTG